MAQVLNNRMFLDWPYSVIWPNDTDTVLTVSNYKFIPHLCTTPAISMNIHTCGCSTRFTFSIDKLWLQYYISILPLIECESNISVLFYPWYNVTAAVLLFYFTLGKMWLQYYCSTPLFPPRWNVIVVLLFYCPISPSMECDCSITVKFTLDRMWLHFYSSILPLIECDCSIAVLFTLDKVWLQYHPSILHLIECDCRIAVLLYL